MKKLVLLTAATMALLAAPVTSSANHWTSVGSAGVVDEDSLDNYVLGPPLPGAPFPIAGLSILSTAVDTVTARYNVTNTATTGTPSGLPGWTTFELGYTDTAPGFISATLYSVQRCSGFVSTICPIPMAPPTSTSGNCITCMFPSTTFNFEIFAYFVEVKVRRDGPGGLLSVNTLRIY